MLAREKYRICVKALADYANNAGFTDVVIGLSGGMDSSIVAAMCVDAFGAEHVHGVLLPGPYSSVSSVDDALELAENLGVETQIVSICQPYEAFEKSMARACGVIMLSPVGSASVLGSLNAVAPLVQCAEYNEESPLPYVGVDDIAAARSATETLLHAGRRRIALINGPDKYKYARHRRQGYEEALRSAGLEVEPRLMASVTEMGFDSSMSVANQMLGSSAHPDAILAASDMYAAAVVKAAATNGLRIPQDLSLISFDNTYISQMHHPSVTSVGLPRFQLGYTAMEVLAERLKGGAAGRPRQFLLKTELVLRDSV